MRRVVSFVAAAVGTVTMIVSPTVAAANATAGDRAGDAVVVDANNIGRLLTEGDSSTIFTLRLPDGAACQRDSANDDWRVSSFLVPLGTDVDSLTFRALRPDGDAYRSLRYVDGDIYVNEMTAANPAPGQEALVLPPPALTYSWFESGSLPAGRYLMGVACTSTTMEVERYWDTEIELIAAPDVEPGGLRWQVVAASATSPAVQGGGSGGLWPALLVIPIVVVVLLAIRNRARGTTRSQQKAPV